MGMFDCLIENDGTEWQTKAYDCLLYSYRVGDKVPHVYPGMYQVKILGEGIDSYATVVDDVLEAINVERSPRLPLVDYYGKVTVRSSQTMMTQEWAIEVQPEPGWGWHQVTKWSAEWPLVEGMEPGPDERVITRWVTESEVVE